MERNDAHESNSATAQIKQALAGGASGAVTRFFCQPLDVLKIRFQLQVEPIWHQQQTSKYKSVSQAVRLMLREEGVLSFWKGHNPAQLLSICYGISQFWCYEQFNIYAKHSEYLSEAHGTRHFLCGGLAGACGMFISAPLDVVRTRLVAQDNRQGYRNSTQGIRTIYRRDGIRGLFRGLGPSLLQVAPLTGAQFYFYNLFGDTLKQFLNMKPSEELPGYELLFVGAMAGVCSKTLVYPLDLTKKRLQIQGFSEHRKTFGKHFVCNGMWDCMWGTVKSEGIKGLYKGLYPTILKSGAATALHFAIYDEIVKHLLIYE